YANSQARANGPKAREVELAIDREVRELLNAAQQKRFDQIMLQMETRNGLENARLTHPRVVEGLKLTKAQQETIAQTFERRRQELFALFGSEDDVKDVLARIQAFKKETPTKLQDALDAEQKAALKDLVGEPFTDRVTNAWGPSRSKGARTRTTRPDTRTLPSTFPRTAPRTLSIYITGMFYLGSP